MGRPAKTRQISDEESIASPTALATIRADSALYSAYVAEAEAKYGDGLDFNEERLAIRAMELMQDINNYAAPKLHEVGCILIRVHANDPKGYVGFLDRIGMSTRAAQKCVQSTKKFGGTAERKKLLDRLSPTKIQELLAIDDESVDAWAKGEEALGLTLDKIDKMSAHELRTALRKEREQYADEKAADEEIIRKKDERINKLSRRSTRSGRRDEINELVADLDRFKAEAAAALKSMLETAGAIDAIYAEAKEQPEEDVQQCIDGALEFASKWMHDLADQLGE